MSLSAVLGVSFSLVLKRIDDDLAAFARASGCSFCGGVLHSARYPRKLRGVRDEIAERFAWRSSFCCAEEECRRRTTPPSVVFLGRRLYFAAAVILASAFARGDRLHRAHRLRSIFGVDRRTLDRWQKWWRESLPETALFRAAAGRFSPPLSARDLPRSLLVRLSGSAMEKVRSALLFLAPVTTGSVALDRTERWTEKIRRACVVIA